MKTIHHHVDLSRANIFYSAIKIRRAFFSLCLAVGCMALTSERLALAQSSPSGELKTAAQVRSLSPQQASQHLPVHLKGVITFCDEGLYSRFVQDDTAGIYFLALPTNMPVLKSGQIVEINGVTSPGEYAPIIASDSVSVVGEGVLPPANPVTAEKLVSGQEDSQFVEVGGIVRSVRFEQETMQFLIDLVMNGERFTAYVKKLPVAQPDELVDTYIKVRGVCSTLFNRQRQLFGFRLLVPGVNDVLIEKPAAGNPFDIAGQEIGSLLRFTPQGNYSYSHRVKVSGTVTYYEPGSAVFIQDEKQGVGLYCQTRQRNEVKPGDQVEVLGFPAKGEYTPVLEDAIYRKISDGTVPTPKSLEIDEILSGTDDCQLIQTSAKLVERNQRGHEQFLVLSKNGFTFNAYLGQDNSWADLVPLINGSDISVAGICLIERGTSWRAGEGWRAKSFRLLLRSPQDIVVLKTPSILEQWGTLWIVGSLTVVILFALLWTLMLHRRIVEHQAVKN